MILMVVLQISKYKVWFIIKQYTEYPLFIEGLGEGLDWYRGWASWQNVKLRDLVIVHEPDQSEEEKEGISTMYAEEIVESDSPFRSASIAYNKMKTKLNLLSLISQKGFLIKSVFPNADLNADLNSELDRFESLIHENQPTKTSSKNQIQINPFFARFIMKTGKSEDYLSESVEAVYSVLEGPELKRNIHVIKLPWLQDEWNRAFTNFFNLDIKDQPLVNQSMEIYRMALTSGGLYSRYLLQWIALDLLTPFVKEKGSKKIAGMSVFIGSINGVADLKLTLEIIYGMRNDIAHGRAQQINAFDIECKKGLLWLEWILTNFVRMKLGLNQINERAAPKERLELTG